MQSTPLSLPLSHVVEREKNKNKSLCILFFNSPLFKRGARGDFINARKVKKKNLLYIL